MATLSEWNNKLNQQGKTASVRRGQEITYTGNEYSKPQETKYYEKPKSNIEKSAQWAGNVAKSMAQIGGFVTKKTAGFVANTGADIVKSAYRASASLNGTDALIANVRQQSLDEATKVLTAAQDKVMEQYKSGKMSKEDYIKSLAEINKGLTKIGQDAKSLQNFADPKGRAMDVIETGATLLSTGSLKLGTQGIKQVAASNIDDFAVAGAKGIEKTLLKSKAARTLIQRNMAQDARIAAAETTSQYITMQGKKIAADLLIKRPLFYQSNIADTQQLFQGILTGNYPQAVTSAAWLAANMVNGGPLGKAFEYLGKGRTLLSSKMYGKGSVIDEISKKIGNGESGQIARLIKDTAKKAPNEGKQLEDTFRIIVERSLRVSGDDPVLAAENILRTYGARDLTKLSATDIYKDAKNWRDAYDTAQEFAQTLVKKGKLSPEEARSIIPVRIDAGTRDAIADTVFNTQGPDEAWEAVQKMAEEPTSGWGNNKNFMAELEKIIKTSAAPTRGKTYFHGSTNNALESLVPGAKTGLNEKRNLVYLAESEDTASNYAKSRGAGGVGVLSDSKTGRVYPVQVEGTVLDAYNLDELARLKTANGFSELSGKTKNQITNPTGLSADILEANDELVKFLKDNDISAVRAHLVNGGGFEIIVINPDNMKLASQVQNGGEEAARRIRAIDAAQTIPPFVNKTLRTKLAKLGFTVAEPAGRLEVGYVDPADTRKLVTNAIKGGDLFDEGIIPDPTLNQFATFLQKTGMSPRSSNIIASRVLSENVIANLDNTTAAAIGLNAKGDVPKGGQAILKELSDYIENKKGVLGLGKSAASDLRQLFYKEIREALPGLKLTRGQAKELSKAIKQGYLEVPLEFRGAGDKIVDALYRYNPLHKTYSRIQSALRYSYNPFFRVQERTETAILSRVQANNLLWNKPRAVLDDTVRKLDEARILSSSMYGEAAQDQVLGRITANITQGQKRDLAGLALDIANRKGMTIDELITNHADEIDDALRVVVQYPRKGFLASPMARTLNTAFFPMRYNLKVTKLAAEALAKQPPYIQKAVLHSMLNMKDWLQSEEGILWQQQHQDAIKLFNWITPINSIAYTLNLLTNRPDELSDLGMLGGLPLGIITQILDSQGIISINNPYVDKSTGKTFPKYIPESTKARAATALTDLLGSMFTYPGRTLGLPGKGEGLRAVVGAFIDTNGADFEKRLDESQLTDLDKKWIEVIKNYQKTKKIDQNLVDEMYNMPAPGQFNWYTLPPNTLPFKTVKSLEPVKVERREGLPTKAQLKATSKKQKTKKIAQPIE